MTTPCNHLFEPLDWSGAEHWATHRLPCVLCGGQTNLRNTAGQPAHKSCVELALARIRRERVTGRTRTGLYPVPDDDDDEVAAPLPRTAAPQPTVGRPRAGRP